MRPALVPELAQDPDGYLIRLSQRLGTRQITK
jgi:hypothetical protein